MHTMLDFAYEGAGRMLE